MEKNKREHKLTRHKTKVWQKCTFVFVVLTILLGLTYIQARYISVHSAEGKTVASTSYFTSNALHSVTLEDETTFLEYFNTTAWDGTGICSIPVEIMNYENSLLYNDKELNVVYDITFQLQEEITDNSKYEIQYGKNQSYKILLQYKNTLITSNQEGLKELGSNATIELVRDANEADQVIFHNVELNGGVANSQVFNVAISSGRTQSGTNITSSSVKVWTQIKSPSYMSASGDLGALIKASSSAATFTMESDFAIKNELTEENYRTVINSQSGFVYNIHTSGGSGIDNNSIKIIWDTRLEIDYFNEYYQQAKKNNKFGTVEENPKKKWMIIEVEPYSNIQINFYRSSNTNNPFDVSNFQSFNDFLNLVSTNVESKK